MANKQRVVQKEGASKECFSSVLRVLPLPRSGTRPSTTTSCGGGTTAGGGHLVPWTCAGSTWGVAVGAGTWPASRRSGRPARRPCRRGAAGSCRQSLLRHPGRRPAAAAGAALVARETAREWAKTRDFGYSPHRRWRRRTRRRSCCPALVFASGIGLKKNTSSKKLFLW